MFKVLLALQASFIQACSRRANARQGLEQLYDASTLSPLVIHERVAFSASERYLSEAKPISICDLHNAVPAVLLAPLAVATLQARGAQGIGLF